MRGRGPRFVQVNIQKMREDLRKEVIPRAISKGIEQLGKPGFETLNKARNMIWFTIRETTTKKVELRKLPEKQRKDLTSKLVSFAEREFKKKWWGKIKKITKGA